MNKMKKVKRTYKPSSIKLIVAIAVIAVFIAVLFSRSRLIEIKDVPDPRLFNLTGKFVESPDFIYIKDITSDYIVNLVPFDEKMKLLKISNELIHYEVGPLWGRYGIIYMHPKSEYESSWVEMQTNELRTDATKLYLLAGVGNANGQFGFTYPPQNCADVGFQIKVIGDDGKAEKILDRIVSDREMWVDLRADITRYKGQKLNIIIESYAGGPCGSWKGEHAVLDYVDITEEPA